MSTDPILLTAVSKRFGSVVALDNAGIGLQKGGVAAIVGENGAGKSTLAKIIAGILPKDAGDIVVNGVPVANWSRRQALQAGIGFVPQTLSLVATLSVLDNYLLAGQGFRLDRKQALAELSRAAEAMGTDIDFLRPSEKLSLAERQLGEIVAALAGGANVLLLDEPTSALGPVEVDRLIGTMRKLGASGRTVGLVTHRISEVMEAADRVTVLRAGRVVYDGETAGLEREAVARLMVGDRNRSLRVRTPFSSGRARLTVENLTVVDADQTLLDRVSLVLREGEILAVAGVSSASQPALAEAIAGLRAISSGRVALDGREVTADPHAAFRAGLAFIPENRSDGVVAGLSISENASLPKLSDPVLSRFGLRRKKAEADLGAGVIRDFDIRPPQPDAKAGGLSGGNQQKLLVGRELAIRPAVIVAHGPTQGLDLAAAAIIRNGLTQAADAGAAVLVISADLDELLDIANRLVVLFEGRIVAEFDLSSPPDIDRIGQAMTGLKPVQEPA
nr:ATP-binding cassette domain-containing protein [Rhizobium sp. ACO-34A]